MQPLPNHNTQTHTQGYRSSRRAKRDCRARSQPPSRSLPVGHSLGFSSPLPPINRSFLSHLAASGSGFAPSPVDSIAPNRANRRARASAAASAGVSDGAAAPAAEPPLPPPSDMPSPAKAWTIFALCCATCARVWPGRGDPLRWSIAWRSFGY